MFIADGDATKHVPFLTDYLHTQFDPAHLLSELGFTIVFDLILVWLIWGKILKPRLMKQVHAELDAEHGIDHDEQKEAR